MGAEGLMRFDAEAKNSSEKETISPPREALMRSTNGG